MNIWQELQKMTDRQLKISNEGNDDDKCPCCGRPVASKMKQYYLNGERGYCPRCGCIYTRFGIVGWKI